ncbi:MAG: hypothetical protein EOQ92_00345 [Mesorhizobium sp.]|uniref:hypothetical protein n=1 Tax=Mesorhizobium sp. TaxID=1871066 RepID=UPI000FE6AD8C|nr:hypothetical protein [Mesorhizobium sp.]RWI29927.1 MAG: hypothetical protein EOQ92_00345 [Mesorhizobium sp.]RWK50440.1 MAG: hypothetical protein EOR47_10895 [Mesorhizobium sp.]RWK98299.1 MAG: hypothetical protein EOR53_01055 [Mesorhizobium sp.]TIP56562.1 MAG: hypothetical protein E5X56_23950 [Mesorhizobium sp.]TIQ96736.1 MAG: hypothetical protein E5X44_07315 [Mesorhizobium sp.]
MAQARPAQAVLGPRRNSFGVSYKITASVLVSARARLQQQPDKLGLPSLVLFSFRIGDHMDHHRPRSAAPGPVDRTARKGHFARLQAAFHSFGAARLRARVFAILSTGSFLIRSKRLGTPQPSTKMRPASLRVPLKQTKYSRRSTEKRLKRRQCMTIGTEDSEGKTGLTKISIAKDKESSLIEMPTRLILQPEVQNAQAIYFKRFPRPVARLLTKTIRPMKGLAGSYNAMIGKGQTSTPLRDD